MITLTEFLTDLEFEYKINDNNTISLVDQLGADLNHIEQEEFEICKNLPMMLVDRLEQYIDDYHIEGIQDTLIHDCKYEEDLYMWDTQLIPAMRLYPTYFDEDLINYIDDIVNANIDITEIYKD